MSRTARTVGLGALALAAAASPALSVSGGRPTTPAEFPGVVNLMDAPGCSGTLISPTRVAIAAHCAPSVIPGYATVTIAGQKHTVTRVAVHPHFAFRAAITGEVGPGGKTASGAYDVGVAEIAPPVTAVAPVPVATAEPAPGAPVTIVGYGTDSEGKAGKLAMRAGDMAVLADDACAAQAKSTPKDPNPALDATANICATDADGVPPSPPPARATAAARCCRGARTGCGS